MNPDIGIIKVEQFLFAEQKKAFFNAHIFLNWDWNMQQC